MPKPMGEINMTPLIDVMLVLLIIFMISAPLMTSSLRLDLPQSEVATPGDAPAVLSIALQSDGSLYLGDEKLAPAQLQHRIAALAKDSAGMEVQLRADKTAPYGSVAELIGWCQAAGLNRIAFVTQTE
ncbi:biopolymer transporter ExbD [Paucibacter sp. PLA-PC-4]|uniref:ExbD/TolR family protein n=1 Tax=Paucibacter sp. PLA-PC-4 TaxID=2993655 RepID=UPI002B054476|nr:biopolymer transporter ExbD [Paucibacter sp. PLA-PC-4]